MGGFFGAASQTDCVFDLFFGIDYHSHLGTRRAGMAVYSPETGFDKAIHNIENAPFRTKFTTESQSMHGTLGIGCISRLALREAFRRGSLKAVETPGLDLRRQFQFVTHRRKHVTAGMREFITLCRQMTAGAARSDLIELPFIP